MRTTAWLAVVAASSVSLLMAVLGACGSAAGRAERMGAGGSASGASGGGDTGGGLLTGGSAGTTLYDSGVRGDSGVEGCAKASFAGEPVPVDIFVMLDKSGSMEPTDDSADAGPTPWAAVTSAITEFMTLPGTEGIGMGLGVFPVAPSFVPLQCSKPEDCLPYSDICLYNQCLANLGQSESCISEDYRKPAVAIDLLPGVAASINTAMSSAKTGGSTPMAPALWGALEYTAQWSSAHPTHAVLVVL
ncbi:MAG: hypothetical protein MUF54_14160, partial [Polyangiaceae bacterium]|nr:hypothetical protein [Polyangiaceae bacterium]